MRAVLKVGLFGILLSFLTGCAHSLEVKNLSNYYSPSRSALKTPIKMRVVDNSYESEGKWFVHEIVNTLPKYNVRATTDMMYDQKDLDVIATISVRSSYKGSGMNFLIDWPGFLIFTPAWNGYIYKVEHKFDITLKDAKTGERINSFRVPISLDVRHASMKRTWLAESGWWLLYSIPSAVGGVVHTSYDSGVTPLLRDETLSVIADYVSQEIINNL